MFACSLTGAVYLELMPSLKYESFIENFKLFIARRDRSTKAYSVKAKSFVSAASWLQTAPDDEKFKQFLSKLTTYVNAEFNALCGNNVRTRIGSIAR